MFAALRTTNNPEAGFLGLFEGIKVSFKRVNGRAKENYLDIIGRFSMTTMHDFSTQLLMKREIDLVQYGVDVAVHPILGFYIFKIT